MSDIIFGIEYWKELESEGPATRKCLERVPENLYSWKPHEKSMTLEYLTVLVADIPRWISHMIEKSEIDFATYSQFKATNTADIVKFFDDNMNGAKKALESVSNKRLEDMFYLKNQGTVLFSSPIKYNVWSSINHMVHHRGQLTVYLRLNNIPVPSIYGPSADEKMF